MRVELDKQALFALASDSRIEILKALGPQRRTVTQLADSMGIDKAAVHRHLKKLEEGGFVVRDEDHGFVYYGLSWKARDIISPGENTKIVIVFAMGWLMVAGAAVAIWTALSGIAARGAEVTQGSTPGGAGDQFLGLPEIGWEWTILGVLLAVLAIGLIYLGYRRLRRPRQTGEIAKGVRPVELLD
ncbi:MAG: winged helix-turn-helix domain-containing protein [Methanomassiliicoccales archaeon]|nr:winged helix-turn-helix domain-containing protein [Methanomassiliicoccales archaeon]